MTPKEIVLLLLYEETIDRHNLRGSDRMAMDLLRDFFYYNMDKEYLAKIYHTLGKPSFIYRILSNKSGVDTSRKQRVRNLFAQWLVKIGRPYPFEDYNCPPSKRKKKVSPGFGLLKG